MSFLDQESLSRSQESRQTLSTGDQELEGNPKRDSQLYHHSKQIKKRDLKGRKKRTMASFCIKTYLSDEENG